MILFKRYFLLFILISTSFSLHPRTKYQCLDTINVPRLDGSPTCCKWNPKHDYKHVLALGYGKTVVIWDAKKGRRITDITLKYDVSCFDWYDHGTWLLINTQNSTHLLIYEINIENGKTAHLATINPCGERGKYIDNISFDPKRNNNIFYCTFFQDNKYVSVIKDNKIIGGHYWIDKPPANSQVAFVNSERELFAYGASHSNDNNDSTLWFRHPNMDTQILKNAQLRKMALTYYLNYGAFAYNQGNKTTLTIWPVTEPQKRYALKTYDSITTIHDLLFSPGDNKLLASTVKNDICIWDWQNNKLLDILQDHKAPVTKIDWSNGNEKMLVSASDDGTFKIWGKKEKENLKISKSNILEDSFDIDELTNELITECTIL